MRFLYGQITDTNSQWISAELDKIGVKTIRKSSVGDDEEQILGILKEASQRANVILMTGGLGPTKDDITKKTLAKYFGAKLVIHEPALQKIEEFFKRGAFLFYHCGVGRIKTMGKIHFFTPFTCDS